MPNLSALDSTRQAFAARHVLLVLIAQCDAANMAGWLQLRFVIVHLLQYWET
jgi:hypothetical protein